MNVDVNPVLRPTRTATGISAGIRLMIGPLALALVLYHIVSSGPRWLGPADLAYFVISAGMILGAGWSSEAVPH